MNNTIIANSEPKIEYLFVNIQFKSNEFEQYLNNLKQEISNINLQYHFQVKSIYLSGADLSVLSIKQIVKLLTLLNQFATRYLVEYSFECHVIDNFASDKLKVLKNFHINRLVWKIVSFQQNLGQKINTNYQRENVIENIKKSSNNGFANFSIELKYNLLNQKVDDIIADIEQCIILNAPHISYESNNHRENLTLKKIINEKLASAGYDNYEVFSYSKSSNYQSQQTLGYLKLNNWYGLGPGAHGFVSTKQEKIIIKNTKASAWKTIKTVLSNFEYYQLYLVQGLMLKNGIIISDNNLAIITYYQEPIKQLIKQKLLTTDNKIIKTTTHGWILLNEILNVIINSK